MSLSAREFDPIDSSNYELMSSINRDRDGADGEVLRITNSIIIVTRSVGIERHQKRN